MRYLAGFLCLWASPLLAEIEGPEEVDVGEKLILRSSEGGEWDLGSVPKSRYEVFDDGKVVCVWTVHRESIRAILVVGVASESGVTLTKYVHEVAVKGTGPNPPDPKPDELTGDAKAVYDLLQKSNPPTGEASELADNYFDIASRLAAGDMKASEVMPKTVELNRSDVSDREKWVPFFTAMQDFLSGRGFEGDGTKKNAAEYQALWMQIGGGLRAYAKK